MAEADHMEELEQRVLVFAPFGQDAEVSSRLLGKAGFAVRGCADVDELIAEIERGAGAVLLTAEALSLDAISTLAPKLEEQPAWSDLPLVIMMNQVAQGMDRSALWQGLGTARNVTVLQRPLSISSLASVVRVALRGRERQYEVRDYLREREQRAAELEAVLQSIPDPIYVITTEGIKMTNEPGRRLLGIETGVASREKLVRLLEQLDVRDANTGEPLAGEDLAVIQALEGVSGRQELRLRHPVMGKPRIYRSAAAPIWVGETVVGAVSVNVDVTEHRQAEEALRRGEARFRTTVESLLDALGIYSAVRDEQGEIVDFQIDYVNEAACHLNRMSREEQIGRHLLEILPAHQETGLFDRYCELVETGAPLSVEGMIYVDSYGREGNELRRAFDVRAARLGDGFVATWRDVTERQQTQATLQQARVDLEARVKERTAELTYTNAILQEQVEVRERAEAQLRRRNKQLATLNTVTAALSSSLDAQEIFSTLERLLVEELEIPGGALLFHHAGSSTLELGHSWGFPPEIEEKLGSLPAADPYFSPAIRREEVVHHNDLRQVQLYTDLGLPARRPDWRSALCVPLSAQREVLGVLCLFSESLSFSGNQQTFFVTVAQQVGVAVANARLYEDVVNKQERLQQLAQRIISVQEEERHRVSRELHDEAGQALTALMLSLEMTRGALPAELDGPRGEIGDAVELAGETIEQIRRLAHDLHTPSLETIGLNATLRGLCQDMSKRTRLAIEYHGQEIPHLPTMAAVSLYRVVQEALTNVARHAEADKVKVTLDYDGSQVRLSIEDNGRGFDARSTLYTPSTSGIGLSGLQERMETLGGWLEIDSHIGNGTLVRAHLPYVDMEPAADAGRRARS